MSKFTKAICKVSTSALKKSSYTRSVMVTQILFGEICIINDTYGRYFFAETLDGLMGWVLKEHFELITPDNRLESDHRTAFSIEALAPIVTEEFHLNIPFGSYLNHFDGITCNYSFGKFTFNSQAIVPIKDKITPRVLARVSRQLLNAPYLQGGMTVFGMDNINLIYLIYNVCGYTLSRDISQLLKMGDVIDFVEQVQIGDIAYFENKKGNISHAGIIIGPSEILHLHNTVKIDYLDHFGIYSGEKKRYTHKLRLVKRIFPTYKGESVLLLKDKKEITNQIKLFG